MQRCGMNFHHRRKSGIKIARQLRYNIGQKSDLCPHAEKRPQMLMRRPAAKE
jgi:hypothetical protein